MLELARRSNKDRADIFTATAVKIGMNEAIVEKDFWVCWMLELLFHHSNYSNRLSFKGGTSLSKGYGIIERFSEDIDLILDWRLLGYDLNEPWNKRSNSAQDRFNTEANSRTEDFLVEVMMPHLDELAMENGIEGYKFYIDDNDKQTIRFVYPQLFSDKALVQEIRLEIGSLAAWTPLTKRVITPYVAEEFPHVFEKKSTSIRTVDAKRTFWEKATILHSESHRTGTKVPQRYSRHYYDLYLLSKSHVKEDALDDFELLEKVAAFKSKFYRSNRARYDLATKDDISLLPPSSSLVDLEVDYKSMQSMIFGEKIDFDEILMGLEQLVEEIRSC
jgi:hypothetical protein